MKQEVLQFPEGTAQIWRNTDPDTSQEAGEELLANPKRLGRLQMKAYSAVEQYPDHTAKELSDRVRGKESATIRRRLRELVRAGRIEISGKRVCSITGKKAQTYCKTREAT